MFDAAEWDHMAACWSDMQGHMGFLRETAASYPEPVIIEFGVRTGNSTACFLAAAQERGGQVWSADIAPAQVPPHWHDTPWWHFLEADDISEKAQAWLPAQCDVLFIDSSHQYGHTLTELALYVPRVRPGGVVLLHDTEWEQTGPTPDHCRQLGEPGGAVTAALDEWTARTGMAWENRPGSYGLGIIRIPSENGIAVGR